MRPIRAFKSNPRNFLLRLWAYFRRGHSAYLAFILSFANFIVLQYRLLIQYVPFLKYLFINMVVFAIVFVLVYVPIAIIIGYLDYKKMVVPVELEISARASPWFKDLAQALILIAEGKNREAVEILKKWASK